MSSTEPRRRLRVFHVVRRLVEVLEQLLEQTRGEPFLGGRSSDSTFARLFTMSRHAVLARPRHLLTATYIT